MPKVELKTMSKVPKILRDKIGLFLKYVPRPPVRYPKRFPKFCDFQSLFAVHSFKYSASKKFASSSEIRPCVRADAILFP